LQEYYALGNRVTKRTPRLPNRIHGVSFDVHFDVHLLWVGFQPSPQKQSHVSVQKRRAQ
jgi:hypothetical protein